MVDRARHYHPAAYSFVRQALDFGLNQIGQKRHISGQELVGFICEFARLKFGPLANFVFEEWGIRETLDFGHIVYDLIEQRVMAKQPEDSIEHFREVSDFRVEFDPRRYDFLSDIRSSWSLRPRSQPRRVLPPDLS